MIIRELRGELLKMLAPLDTTALEARIILSHFLSLSTSELITKDYLEVDDDVRDKILKAASERLEGRPMAYITGKKEFYGYTFRVNENVLIPQPDTEVLVESALNLIKGKEGASVLDICTGSGAIITAIKKERRDIKAYFSDISEKALSVAIENYESLTRKKADARLGSLFEPWKGMTFDLITANAPYVTKEWYLRVSEEVKREPYIALVDEESDGLGIIRRIIDAAKTYLEKDGHLILEADYRQHGSIRAYLKEKGFTDIQTKKDLGGLERITIARKKGL